MKPNWVRRSVVCFAFVAAGLIQSSLARAESPYGFTHGIASGDVTDVSAVLWTRVVRDGTQREHGDQDDRRKVSVRVEVALDPAFRRPHFKETVHAHAADDFTVKVIAGPLLPDHVYFYRWRHGSAVSRVGQTAANGVVSADGSVGRISRWYASVFMIRRNSHFTS